MRERYPATDRAWQTPIHGYPATVSSPAVALSSNLLAVGSQVFLGIPGGVRCRVKIELHHLHGPDFAGSIGVCGRYMRRLRADFGCLRCTKHLRT